MHEHSRDRCSGESRSLRGGLAHSNFGNVSAVDRDAEVVAIKPSGVPYAELVPRDALVRSKRGRSLEG